jgi:adenosylhomocysteinase
VFVVGEGVVVNLSAGEGHPVEIMDLSFSVQALSAHHLASHDLGPGIHPFPPELDREIARTKLATLGVQLDELRPSQRAFLEGWTTWE